METNRKVAVVTGASSGIGRATAEEFARRGYDVVLAARRKDELNEVAEQCESHDVNTLVFPLDTADDKAVNGLKDAAVKAFGRIDAWVNNAAVYLAGKFEDTPLDDMHRMMDTNFFGYVHGSHAALVQFKVQGYGTLINVSSINAIAPQPYVSIYSASKAAVRAFDESLRMELKLDKLSDIHVSTVMPAAIDTNLFRNGANYTGKSLQAAEPVYDPLLVARQIVKLASHPKREIIVGGAGRLMAAQRLLTPGMYEKQVGLYTRADLLGDEPAVTTDGNLYAPIERNTGIKGGWSSQRLSGEQFNKTVGIGAAALGVAAGIGILVLSQLRNRSSKTFQKQT